MLMLAAIKQVPVSSIVNAPPGIKEERKGLKNSLTTK